MSVQKNNDAEIDALRASIPEIAYGRPHLNSPQPVTDLPPQYPALFPNAPTNPSYDHVPIGHSATPVQNIHLSLPQNTVINIIPGHVELEKKPLDKAKPSSSVKGRSCPLHDDVECNLEAADCIAFFVTLFGTVFICALIFFVARALFIQC